MQDRHPAPQPHPLALKSIGLALAVVAIGLPVNDIDSYALLVLLAVVIFTGEVNASWRAWLAGVAIVAVTVIGQVLLAPPRIDEGHNVFIPGGALEQGLPPQVYRHLANEFDRQYPPAQRCGPNVSGCWVNGGVWGTVEGRAIMGYYRLNKADDVLKSATRAMKWAKDYRMDAPFTQRGENTHNLWSDSGGNQIGGVAVMVDNFAIPAATVRGLFEYIYKADRIAKELKAGKIVQ